MRALRPYEGYEDLVRVQEGGDRSRTRSCSSWTGADGKRYIEKGCPVPRQRASTATAKRPHRSPVGTSQPTGYNAEAQQQAHCGVC